MSVDLRDRLYRRMIDSNRPWPADEIARETLKIVSDVARAERLVIAILGSDPRFLRRGESTWQALARPAPALADLSFLLVDVPRSFPADAAPVFLQSYDPRHGRAGELITVQPDGSGLIRLVASFEDRLLASFVAPAARRGLHRLERLYAIPATSERLLDLTAWQRAMDVPARAPFARGGDEGIEERMHAARAALDDLLDRGGAQTLEEVEALLESGFRGEEIEFSSYRFSREDLDRIPPRPGIYRFLGESGDLLYVGKSRDLRRRVTSYFRPLAPDHRRRASLLEAIRSLEWETVPSELEALLLESEAIRAGRPLFNQQIEIHCEGEAPAVTDGDLAFVLCEGDPDEVSAFLLRDRMPWARARLPRASGEAGLARAREVAVAWIEGRRDPGCRLHFLDAAAGAIVLRFLKIHRDRIDWMRREDFADGEGMAAALAELAARERPAWEPWRLRGPADPL